MSKWDRKGKSKAEAESWANLPTRSKRIWKNWNIRDMNDPRYAPGDVITRKATEDEIENGL